MMGLCPNPDCLSCILGKPEPLRSKSLKKAQATLHQGTRPEDAHERGVHMLTLRDMFLAYETAMKEGEVIPHYPPVSLFLDNGLIPCLLNIAQLKEAYLRPMAMEVLRSVVTLRAANLEDLLIEGKLMKLLEVTLFTGLCCEQYEACLLIIELSHLGLFDWSDKFDLEKLISGVVYVSQIKIQKLRAEIADDSPTRWEMNMMETYASDEFIKKFSTRYFLQVHEMAAIALCVSTYYCFPDPQKRLRIAKTPNVIPGVLKYLTTVPHEAHPEARPAVYMGEVLLMLVTSMPGQPPCLEIFQHLAKVLKVDQLKFILDFWDEHKIESIITEPRNLKKYGVDDIPDEDELLVTFMQWGLVRSFVVHVIKAMAEYTDKAAELVPLASDLDIYAGKLLREEKRPQSVPDILFLVAQGADTKNWNDQPHKYNRCGLLNICLLSLLNLEQRVPSFKSKLDNFQKVVATQATKTKDEGNMYFQKKDFVSAVYFYGTSIELGEKSNPKHPDLYIFYSNRSETFLQMEMYKEALEDAKKALALKPDHEKSLVRKERALDAVMKQVD